MSEQQKEQAKIEERKEQTPAPLFWAYGLDDFLRSGADGSSARDDHPQEHHGL